MSKQTWILGIIGIVVVVGVIAGAKWAQNAQNKQVDQGGETAERIVRSDSQVKGNATAPVTVVEFGDFQCPSCGALAPTMEALMTEYSADQVKWVFRNFPLTMHQHAKEAAYAAQAAAQQGKFWEYNHQLFASQNDWSDDIAVVATFDSYAKDLGLDMDKFTSDRQSQTVKDFVARDLADAEALQLTGTPTLFINGVQYTGSMSSSGIKQEIDRLINEANQS